MKEAMKSAPRIDKEVAGLPVEAHGYIVTPYARVRGMVGSQDGAPRGVSSDTLTGQSSGRYGWAAIRPVRITVQDRSGEVREVRLVDIEGQVMKLLATVGALVFVISVLASLGNRSRR